MIRPVSGRVIKTWTFPFPNDAESLDIFDLATDDKDCVALTADIEDAHSNPPVMVKRIYRFWMTDGKDEAKLSVFAKSKDTSDFNGIAVSKHWGYVFTTEGNNIIAFSSISIGRSQMGHRVFKCYMGPDPFIHAIHHSDEEGADLLCSSEFNVVDKILTMKQDGKISVKKDKRFKHSDFEDLKTAWPGMIAAWDDNVVVSKGYWLSRFVGFPRNTKMLGSIAPAYSPKYPLDTHKALAAMKTGEVNYFASFNDSDFITVSVLPKDGCCLLINEN